MNLSVGIRHNRFCDIRVTRRIVIGINSLHNPIERLAMNVADDYFR
jgi:hypothetical protein